MPGAQNLSRGFVHYTVHLFHSAINISAIEIKLRKCAKGEAVEFTFYYTALYFLLSMSFLYEAAYLRTSDTTAVKRRYCYWNWYCSPGIFAKYGMMLTLDCVFICFIFSGHVRLLFLIPVVFHTI